MNTSFFQAEGVRKNDSVNYPAERGKIIEENFATFLVRRGDEISVTYVAIEIITVN
ncbi:MAG: hypothetical protein WC412_00025 [Candidatus Omnitrophota bacterium]|jgi:hypothetical protein